MSESTYVLVTNFWNEEHNIRPFFDTVRRQTKKPSLWILIDDGSTDRSWEIASSEAEATDIPTRLLRMPRKERGNVDKIGCTYTQDTTRILKKFQVAGVGYKMTR